MAILAGGLLFAQGAMAQGYGLDYASQTGLGTRDLRDIAISIVNIVLGFLGIAAVIMILYGGYIWMTAAGNAEKIERAKKTLIGAVIGLAIVISAFAIVNFAINKLLEATGVTQTGGTGPGPGPGPSPFVTCPAGQNPYIFTNSTTGKGKVGGLVTVSGCRFGSYEEGKSKVMLIRGEKQAEAKVAVCPGSGDPEWSDGKIVVEVPDKSLSGEDITPAEVFEIIVIDKDTLESSNSRSFTVQEGVPGAGIICIVPDHGPESSAVDIYGQRFGSSAGAVRFAGNKTASASSWGNEQIKAAVPAGAITGDVYVVAGGQDSDNGYEFSVTCQNNGQCAESDCCVYGFCAEASFCEEGAGGGDEGAPCDGNEGSNGCQADNSKCKTGLVCSPDDCTCSEPGGEGASCDKDTSNSSCQKDDSLCQNGLICDANSCTCQKGGQVGDPCDGDSETLACEGDHNRCSSSLLCDPSGCTCQALPIIDWIRPTDKDNRPSGANGDFISIGGKNFGKDPGEIIFLGADTNEDGEVYGDSDDKSVSSNNTGCPAWWSDDLIIIAITNGAVNGPIEVKRSDGKWDRTDKYFDGSDKTGTYIDDINIGGTARPGLCPAQPGQGKYGSAVTLTGKGFGSSQGASKVYFGGVDSGNAGAWKSEGSYIETSVPAMSVGETSIVVSVNKKDSNPVDFNVSPLGDEQPRIDYINPPQGPKGQYLTISGKNFGNNGKVEFIALDDSKKAADLPVCGEIWGNGEIIVKVPDLANGDYKVVVSPADWNIASTPASFKVITGTPAAGICKIDPAGGPDGTEIVFEGENLTNVDKIYFGYNTDDESEVAVASSNKVSDQEIKDITVPPMPSAIDYPVVASSSGTISNAVNFKFGSCVKTQQACKENTDCSVGSCSNGFCTSCSGGKACCSDGTCRDKCEEKAVSCSYSWKFITAPKSLTCAGAEQNMCLAKDICPNSPGYCSTNAGLSVGQDCTSEFCNGKYDKCNGNCVYKAKPNICVLNDKSCDIISTTVLSGQTASCNLLSGNYVWQVSLVGGVCPAGSFNDINGRCTIQDTEKRKCTPCPDGFSCLDDDKDKLNGGICVIGPAVCPAGSSCSSSSGQCVSGKVCECCCRKGHEETDCCLGLKCGGTCGAGDDTGTGGSGYNYGLCQGCKVGENQTEYDEKCQCVSTGRICVVTDSNYTDGYCADCAKESTEAGCESHSGTCCWNAEAKSCYLCGSGLPVVIENKDCDKEGKKIQSPSPFKDQSDACNDISITAAFNMEMDAGTFDENMKVVDLSDNSKEVKGSIDKMACGSSEANKNKCKIITFSPTSPLSYNHSYRATLDGDNIKGVNGKKLDGDRDNKEGGKYVWEFTVGNAKCPVDNVYVLPQTASIYKKDDTQKVDACPVAKNCNQLNASKYNWTWNSNKTNKATVAKETDKGYEAKVTAVRETAPNEYVVISAKENESGKKGESYIEVLFADPKVNRYWPNCNSACINGEIGASFNIEMNSLSSSDVKLYFCGLNEECTSLSKEVTGINIVNTPIVYDKDAIKEYPKMKIDLSKASGDYLQNDKKLLPNTYYRVVIKDTAESASFVKLSSLNFDLNGDKKKDSFSWVFSTRSDPNNCAISNITVDPEEITLDQIGRIQVYSASAYSSPDECNADGQALTSYDYDWKWSSSDSSVASISETYACGNMIVEAGEDCDHGPYNADRGCNAQCLNTGSSSVKKICEDGSFCSGDKNCANIGDEKCHEQAVCGNGALEYGEDCDDGNTQTGDGCDANCLHEGSISTAEAICGNGSVEKGEDCDDGNTDDGDGCAKNCINEGSEKGGSFCGDGKITYGEDCDDGNTQNGDGCNSICLNEGDAINCGNGHIDIGEDCDDGNKKNEDGCSSICLNEGNTKEQTISASCGNGTLEVGEDCDDGNTEEGDGCDKTCRNEGSPASGNKNPYQIAIGKAQGESDISAEADSHSGKGLLKLVCGARSDSDCSSGKGIGYDSCCYDRPKIVKKAPDAGAGNICPNSLLEITFDQKIDEGSVKENVILTTEIGETDCPKTKIISFAEEHSFFGRIKNFFIAIINKVFMGKAIAQDVNCLVDAEIVVDKDVPERINITPKNMLSKNTTYKIWVRKGVKSNNGAGYAQETVWSFTTKDTICPLDEVRIEVISGLTKDLQDKFRSEDIFTCAADSGCKVKSGLNYVDDDQDSATSGNQHKYIARTYGSGQELALSPTWDWKISNDKALTLKKISDRSYWATPTAQTAQAIISIEADAGEYGKVADDLNVDIFICDNPWPPLASFPWKKSASDGNFQTFYCRDAGDPGQADDLPALKASEVTNIPELIGFCNNDTARRCFNIGSSCSNNGGNCENLTHKEFILSF